MASSSQFPCKSHPSVLCRLLVSSAPGGFQGHLRVSSDPRRVPSSCIILGVECPLGASSSSFTYKIRTVLSALGVLSTKVIPDHLHSSCTKNVPLSCITSGCPQHRVPSQGISILLHKPSPFMVCHLLASVARGALPEHLHAPSHANHLHPSRISLSSSCSQHQMPSLGISVLPMQDTRSVCHHLLVSLAPGALPGHHQATSLHPKPFGVFDTGCPPGTSLCSFMHKPTSATLSRCFWMFFALLEHLHPP